MSQTANLLLFIMLISYFIPIVYVYSYYLNNQHNNSISSIISNSSLVLCMMIIMGLFTILYEKRRNDNTSLFYICLLLTGIYGVIGTSEEYKIHYLFATLVFLSIIGFMYHHCMYKKCPFLSFFFMIQTILFIFLIAMLCGNSPYFFITEVMLIFNFAIYYIYLHYLQFIS